VKFVEATPTTLRVMITAAAVVAIFAHFILSNVHDNTIALVKTVVKIKIVIFGAPTR